MLGLFMNGLLPVLPGASWADDWSHRLRIAEAIVAVTDDVEEQLTLAKIARYESAYRLDVADCRVKGSVGEVTAWQILARSREERASLCVSLEADARLALARVRESTRACRQLPREERLAIYTRGSCSSAEGRKLSRHRTPGDRALRAFESMIANEPKQEESSAWNE